MRDAANSSYIPYILAPMRDGYDLQVELFPSTGDCCSTASNMQVCRNYLPIRTLGTLTSRIDFSSLAEPTLYRLAEDASSLGKTQNNRY
jgi:hypothetical protein